MLALLNIISLISLFDSSDEGSIAVVLVFLLTGPIYYAIIYMRYRNTDKRHSHETETKAAIENVETADTFVEHRKRLKNGEIHGRNDKAVKGALLDNDSDFLQSVKKLV
jgi:hypothetical protein